MKTAEEVLESVSKGKGYLMLDIEEFTYVMKKYAKLAIKEDRKNVAEHATAGHTYPWTHNKPYVNKESIIKAPNIKLL